MLMTDKDTIEFYDQDKLLASVASSMALTEGNLISIRSKTWRVTGVTFALDHSDDLYQRAMRCNIHVTKQK